MTFEILPASDRHHFRSLELRATASYDSRALARLMTNASAVRQGNGPNSVRLYGAAATTSGNERESYVWRIWWAPPSSWSEELILSGGDTTMMILRAHKALAYVSLQHTLYTSEATAAGVNERGRPTDAMRIPTVAERVAEFPLINPRLPISAWELTQLRQETYLGRPTRRVRAVRRSAAYSAEDADALGYWAAVDEYEYLVDDSLHIVLSLVAIADGVQVATISTDCVRVDAPCPAEMTTFTPPDGTRTVIAPWPP